jgi:hypothetical protein
MRRFIILAALMGATAAFTPAQAHTYQVIVPGQILNGGYINTAGQGEPQQVGDIPASDGTMLWANADPTVTGLQVKCQSGDCKSLPNGAQTRTFATPLGEVTEQVFSKGLWRATTQGSGPTAIAEFRVTGGH